MSVVLAQFCAFHCLHPWLKNLLYYHIVFDYPHSGRVYYFVQFCLYVCLSVTFEIFDIRSSYLHTGEFVSSLYMKVIGSRSRSQEQKRSTVISYSQRIPAYQDKSASLQCENYNNSVSVTHRAVKCACSVGFSAMANRIA